MDEEYGEEDMEEELEDSFEMKYGEPRIEVIDEKPGYNSKTSSDK